MRVENTPIEGLKRIIFPRFGDDRGFFQIPFEHKAYEGAGLPTRWMQINHSHSQRHVLRGLHYQLEHPQGKLVWVTRGAVYDAVVDLRAGSASFGQSYGITLSAEMPQALYIPPDFAHGFLVLSEVADFMYAVTDIYHPASECSLLWSDPAIRIDWPLDPGTLPILTEKDLGGSLLKKAERPRTRG